MDRIITYEDEQHINSLSYGELIDYIFELCKDKKELVDVFTSKIENIIEETGYLKLSWNRIEFDVRFVRIMATPKEIYDADCRCTGFDIYFDLSYREDTDSVKSMVYSLQDKVIFLITDVNTMDWSKYDTFFKAYQKNLRDNTLEQQLKDEFIVFGREQVRILNKLNYADSIRRLHELGRLYRS